MGSYQKRLRGARRIGNPFLGLHGTGEHRTWCSAKNFFDRPIYYDVLAVPSIMMPTVI